MPIITATVILAAAAAYGGYLFGRDDRPMSTPTDSTESPDLDVTESTTTSIAPTDSGTNSPPISAVDGTFAPPVTIHSDTLGDLEFDAVVDDYSPADPPASDARTSTVDPALVNGDRIDGNLPDGLYWARVHGTFDEDDRGVNFDVLDSAASTGDPRLYPAFVNDLLFVSLRWIDGPTGQNASVTPATFWTLVESGVETIDLAERGGRAEVRSLFLITVIDGVVVAAEGVRNP